MPKCTPRSFIPLSLVLGACASEIPTAPAPDLVARSVVVAAVPEVTPVMEGLDSPRGLAFGPQGALYVVEAGNRTFDAARCAPVARGRNCYSGTGAISRLWKGRQERVASGLPSFYNPVVNDIGGPNDIEFVGLGNATVSIGWGASPAARAGLGATGLLFGTLITVQPNGRWNVFTDIAAFEQANNPAGGPLDSNPYGLINEGNARFVVDAGANTVLRVDNRGTVSLVAVIPGSAAPAPPPFPPFPPAEAVPTEVRRGPDGALYVSTLTGVPFLPGAAAIWRVVPGETPTKFVAGLTQVTDFDWGADGSLYVLQYGSAPFFGGPSAIVRIAANGARTTTTLARLVRPTGIVVGPDNALYVSNRGSEESVGEVLRIVLP